LGALGESQEGPKRHPALILAGKLSRTGEWEILRSYILMGLQQGLGFPIKLGCDLGPEPL